MVPTRRALLAGMAGLTGGEALAAQSGGPRPNGAFDNLPNFCSHEHWGSIRAIGSLPEGYRADVECGAVPREPAGVLDLLVDPYARGWFAGGGINLDQLVAHTGMPFADLARARPWQAFQLLRPVLRQHQATGVYQCVRRGMLALYGADLSRVTDEPAFTKLNGRVAARYADLFAWYRRAMRQARFSELVRIVHPEYFVRGRDSDAGVAERSFTHVIMRIDPFLDWWRVDARRREGLATIAGIAPADTSSWRRFLERMFELAARNGALGIKQLQAYRRPLEFRPREDAEVVWGGDVTPAQVIVFQDWVLHECCKLAHERGWAHQIHVGTNNLRQSSPLPLEELARRYSRMKLVMIHCWPFLEEAGWLAKHVPNVYIDTCWQPVLNPRFFEQALSVWWNYVPVHKITCGHDATSVEMAVGSSLFTREILAEVLGRDARRLGLSEREIVGMAADFLHNNAVGIYGVGRRWEGGA